MKKWKWASGLEYARLFAAVAERDGMVCRWCGRDVLRVPSFWERGLEANHATLDHVIPRSARGPDTVENLVMACYRCNQKRSRHSGSAGPITEAMLIALML